jgi:hypothetical protein
MNLFCIFLFKFKFEICSHSNFVHAKNFCSHSKFVQIQKKLDSKTVHIPNLFRFKFCSNSKKFKFDFVHNSKSVHIQFFGILNLFQIRSKFDQSLLAIQILFKKGAWCQVRDQSPDLQTRPKEKS